MPRCLGACAKLLLGLLIPSPLQIGDWQVLADLPSDLQIGDWQVLADLPSDLRRMLKTLQMGRDAIFDPDDPLPFLALHYLQEVNNLLRIVWLGTPWLKLDLCSGKVVEAGGD